MGYGYQKKEIDKTIIDWSGLTKTISDNLINESNRREELKLKNDQNQAKELEKLSEFEQGLDPNANRWAMEQAQQAREFKMLNHKMMKGGFRSVNEAKLISQNVMDGWSELNKGLKTYNQNYERIGKLGGKGNQFLQSQMAAFADIENKSIWNDPKTGTAYFVDINPKTGEVDKSTLKPVRSLNNIQAQSFETVNVEEATSKLSVNAKPWELATSSTSSIKDARLNPVYKQWKENSIASVLSSDQKVASVLMDYLNIDPTEDIKDDSSQSYTYERVKGYDNNGNIIMEPVTASIGKIKMKYENGKLVPELTDAQRKLAKDAVVASLEGKLARTTKSQYVPPKPVDKKKETEKQLYTLITGALKGNESDLQSLSNSFNFRNIQPQENGDIKITLKNGDTKTIKTSEGIRDGGATFAAALGLNPSEYKRTVGSSLKVNPKFLENIETTSYVKKDLLNQSNIDRLYNSLRSKDSYGDITILTGDEKIASFKNALDGILVDKNVDYSIDSATGDVTVNGIVVKGGINKPKEVLKAVDSDTTPNQSLNATERK